MRIKVIVPFPLDGEGISRREAQIPEQVRSRVEEVRFEPVRESGLLADSFYEGAVMDAYIAAQGVHAEEEGFDAVVIDTVSDSGMDALRSRLSIPVVGPGQTGFHVASALGGDFTILSIWSGWEFGYRRNLRKYAMEANLASLRSLEKLPDLDRLLTDDPKTVRELANLAERAVQEDGAKVIVMGSTTMYQAVPAIAEAVDVPVVNPGLWAFMFAADLVEAGIGHSKRAYPPPVNQRDQVFDRLPPRVEG